jgi:hypothetical protein
VSKGENCEFGGSLTEHKGVNFIHDFYVSPYDISGDSDGTVVRDVDAINGWAVPMDGQPAGTNGPHSSLGGWSFTHRVLAVYAFGHRKSVGIARYENDVSIYGVGDQADASADKLNDGEAAITASFAPDASSPGNSVMTVTTIGTSWVLHVGTRIVQSGVPNDVEILAQLTGTAGKTGTYRVTKSFTRASGSVTSQGRVDGAFFGMLIDSNLAQGLEADYTRNFTLAGVTIITTRDTRLLDGAGPYSPAIYYGMNDAGTKIHHVTACNTAQASTSGAYVADTFRRHSVNNLILDEDATTGKNSFEANYDGLGGGNPFGMAGGRTIEDLYTMFTPKTGGPVALAGAHHDAYYDFENRVPIGDVAAFLAAVPTAANGVTNPTVVFGGTKWARYTVAGAEKLVGFADGSALSITLDVDMKSANAAAATLFATDSNGISITRLTSSPGRLRVTLKGASGSTTVLLDSRVTLQQGERALIHLAFDFANFKFCLMKNGIPDGLPIITTWTGEAMNIDANELTVLASQTGTNITNADVRAVRIANEFMDPPSSQALMDRFVALDGQPVDWGVNPATLSGRVPELLAMGNAAAWNGGINLGNAPRLLVPSATLVDA